MVSAKKRNLFLGGNTANGFFSFYNYIISQQKANKIICLKGGPGTGKSSFMKKIASHFHDLNYNVECHYCSSDNDSLDGVLIKELNIAIVDGTAPHIVDPINPGAVDEIINLGIAFNSSLLRKNKENIMRLNSQIGYNFKRAYKFLKAAKSINDDWSSLNSSSISNYKVLSLFNDLKTKISSFNNSNGYGEDRHVFSTAFTPDGIVSFSKDLSNEVENLYVLKGGPGLKKSTLLKELGKEAQKKGLFVEYFHNPLIPDKLENIIIPEISMGIFTTNEISRLKYDATTYDMENLCDTKKLSNYNEEFNFDKRQFDILTNKATSCIYNAHILHDDLEEFYINAMNFDIINKLRDETISMIESLE